MASSARSTLRADTPPTTVPGAGEVPAPAVPVRASELEPDEVDVLDEEPQAVNPKLAAATQIAASETSTRTTVRTRLGDRLDDANPCERWRQTRADTDSMRPVID